MTNAERFKEIFDLYATEVWSMSHESFLKWLNSKANLEPFAQERKKGKWIDETFSPWGLVYHPYRCDQCGEHSEADSNFCPNCGADMRGETDE